MKTILLSFMLVFTSALYSQNEDIKQVVVTFFKGFHAKDSITMKSVCAEKMILQSISESSKREPIKKRKSALFLSIYCNDSIYDSFRRENTKLFNSGGWRHGSCLDTIRILCQH